MRYLPLALSLAVILLVPTPALAARSSEDEIPRAKVQETAAAEFRTVRADIERDYGKNPRIGIIRANVQRT